MKILCPIENGAKLLPGISWIQKPARDMVSQKFGLNPQIYKRFGMAGHNGIDFAVPIGTPVYASFDGEVKLKHSGVDGYGLHVKLRSGARLYEAVYAHLSELNVVTGQGVKEGDLIGWTGNTGFSTGPHLHFGVRHLMPGNRNIFTWPVNRYKNGYYGYFDPSAETIIFKGTLATTTINPNKS